MPTSAPHVLVVHHERGVRELIVNLLDEDEMQGYLFSQPVAARGYTTLLEKQAPPVPVG